MVNSLSVRSVDISDAVICFLGRSTQITHARNTARSLSYSTSDSKAPPLSLSVQAYLHMDHLFDHFHHWASSALLAICLYGSWQLMWQIASRPPLFWFLGSLHNLHSLFDDNHEVAKTDRVHQSLGIIRIHQLPASIISLFKVSVCVCCRETMPPCGGKIVKSSKDTSYR